MKYFTRILGLGTLILLTSCKTERPDRLEKLIIDVFNPQQGETVLVITDVPHGKLADCDQWQARRELAREWHAALERLGK